MGPEPWEHSRQGRDTRDSEKTQKLKSSCLFLPTLLVVLSISLTVVVHPPLLHSRLVRTILVSVCRDNLNTLGMAVMQLYEKRSVVAGTVIPLSSGTAVLTGWRTSGDVGLCFW